MANEFLAGIQTGQEQSEKRNPFNIITKRFQEASARRYAEDQQRKKEEGELYQSLQVLNKDFLYKQELEKVKAEEERKTASIEQVGKSNRQQNLLEVFGMGRGREGGGDIEVTGGSITSEGEPTFTFGKTAAAKGKEGSVKEAFERAEGIKRAAKKLASITRQFNEALPQEQKDDFTLPFRISGGAKSLAARFGLKANPKLTALQDTSKLQLRSILRDMGEGARMSDQDITQNLAVIEQVGLSDKERMAKVSSFMQTAVDGMDNDTIKLITEDESSVRLLNSFGVKMQGQQSQGKTKAQRANEIAQANPGLSREQIIQRVNQELNQ